MTSTTFATTADRVDVLSWFGDRIVRATAPGKWAMRCPCGRHKHDDKTPSGAVSWGDDAPWIFTCGYGSTADEILAGVGRRLAETYPDFNGSKGSSLTVPLRVVPPATTSSAAVAYKAPKRDELPPWMGRTNVPSSYEYVESYEFTDRDGGIVMVKDRYRTHLPPPEKQKDFRIRSVEGGVWKDKKPPVTLLPYGWQSVTGDSDLVLHVEGEKDANTAHRLGFAAVSIAEGAVDTECLRDKQVLLIADDDSAGERKAQKVEDLLKGVARRVATIRLPNPDATPAFDLTDFVESGGTAEDLRRIASEHLDALPSEVVPFDRLRAEVMQFYERGIEPGISVGVSSKLDEHIKLLAPEIITITGAPGAGKSTFANHVLAKTSEKHGWRWLIYSPEQSPSKRLVSKLLQALYGSPFLQGPTARMSAAQVDAGLEHIRRHFVIVEPQEYGCNLDRLLELGAEMNRREKLNGVCFDPYNVIAATSREAGDSAHDFVNQFMAKMRAFTQAEKLVGMVVAHPKKCEKAKKGKDSDEEPDYPVVEPWDISDSAHWANHSDKILSLWRPRTKKAIQAGDCSVDINIKKVRWQPELGSEGVVTLYYDYRRGRYLDEPPARATWIGEFD